MINLLKCPNCGAPIKPWKQAKCEYCDSYFAIGRPMHARQTTLYADDKPIETYNLDDHYYNGYNSFLTVNEIRQKILTKLNEAELDASQMTQTNEIYNSICQNMSKWY